MINLWALKENKCIVFFYFFVLKYRTSENEVIICKINRSSSYYVITMKILTIQRYFFMVSDTLFLYFDSIYLKIVIFLVKFIDQEIDYIYFKKKKKNVLFKINNPMVNSDIFSRDEWSYRKLRNFPITVARNKSVELLE